MGLVNGFRDCTRHSVSGVRLPAGPQIVDFNPKSDTINMSSTVQILTKSKNLSSWGDF